MLAGTSLGFLSSANGLLGRPAAVAPACVMTAKESHVLPPGFALSPNALGNQTGASLATTDRLIVAARHADVCPQALFATHRVIKIDLLITTIIGGMPAQTGLGPCTPPGNPGLRGLPHPFFKSRLVNTPGLVTV